MPWDICGGLGKAGVVVRRSISYTITNTNTKTRCQAGRRTERETSSKHARTHRGVLLVDEGAEAGLALDDRVGDALLPAERGEPHHQLDGVHVVRDGDEADLI